MLRALTPAGSICNTSPRSPNPDQPQVFQGWCSFLKSYHNSQTVSRRDAVASCLAAVTKPVTLAVNGNPSDRPLVQHWVPIFEARYKQVSAVVWERWKGEKVRGWLHRQIKLRFTCAYKIWNWLHILQWHVSLSCNYNKSKSLVIRTKFFTNHFQNVIGAYNPCHYIRSNCKQLQFL